MAPRDKIDEFLDLCETALQRGVFIKATLGHHTGADATLKQIHIKHVQIKRQDKLSFTYRHKTRDIVKNYDPAEALALIGNYLTQDFKLAHLYTAEKDYTLEKGTLQQHAPSQTSVPAPDHDRKKTRQIETDGKSYLHALKITDDKGQIYKNAQDKFRQIDKYIEILGGLIKQMPEQSTPLHIVDMGSGKGYLTFALYDYITSVLKRACKVTGVEYRKDMVDLCNSIAAESAFVNLHFVEGTIEDYSTDKIDILIALHACDTATDDAIAKGVAADAGLIVVAPCCHKQIRREMEAQAPAHKDLGFLLKYGTFLERQAEMATDGLRALLLNQHGYTTKAFEFISDAHTPKNVMITAVRTGKPSASQSHIDAAKAFFGITRHHLEDILRR